MKSYWTLLVSLVLIIVLNSCKSGKSSIASTGSLAGVTASEYFDTILGNELQYNTLSGKMNIELKTGDKKIGSKATLKLQKDKALQISVLIPIFGSEMFRLHVTPDSIVIIDRLNQRYIAEDISTFKAQNADVDFNVLQSLFTNSLFIPGQKNVAKSDFSSFKIKQKDDQMFLTLKSNQKLNYTFAGDFAHHIMSTSINAESSDYNMNWKYSDFQNAVGVQFPFNIGVAVNGKNKKMDVNFSFSKIEKDTKLNIDFSIPSKYKRIGMNDLLNILIK